VNNTQTDTVFKAKLLYICVESRRAVRNASSVGQIEKPLPRVKDEARTALSRLVSILGPWSKIIIWRQEDGLSLAQAQRRGIIDQGGHGPSSL
jgi:hypothetical protein